MTALVECSTWYELLDFFKNLYSELQWPLIQAKKHHLEQTDTGKLQIASATSACKIFICQSLYEFHDCHDAFHCHYFQNRIFTTIEVDADLWVTIDQIVLTYSLLRLKLYHYRTANPQYYPLSTINTLTACERWNNLFPIFFAIKVFIFSVLFYVHSNIFFLIRNCGFIVFEARKKKRLWSSIANSFGFIIYHLKIFWRTQGWVKRGER